ncbi:MAG: hypothetical protein VXW65_05845 [Pseudomonadota bacterium]|nr:hypothetical protein [Pseudomonadota bacterium]
MLREDIRDINDLIRLVQQGEQNWLQYGHVQVRQHGDILMFNYTDAAESAGCWNAFERMSRGLMIHRQTGEVVARPFDKFFNWGVRTAPMLSWCASPKKWMVHWVFCIV